MNGLTGRSAGTMRSLTLASLRRPRSGLRIGVNLIRARLWVAMLGLAVLPMVGVILLTNVAHGTPACHRERGAQLGDGQRGR